MKWKLSRHKRQPWAIVSMARIHHCPGEGLASLALAQQPGAASSFPVLMFVFKFLRPVSALPGVESAGPVPLLPSFTCLTRLVCRVGHLAKPLPLTLRPAVRAKEPPVGELGKWEALGHGRGTPRGPFRPSRDSMVLPTYLFVLWEQCKLAGSPWAAGQNPFS